MMFSYDFSFHFKRINFLFGTNLLYYIYLKTYYSFLYSITSFNLQFCIFNRFIKNLQRSPMDRFYILKILLQFPNLKIEPKEQCM